jgi:isoleucyl-tRNA synthetase
VLSFTAEEVWESLPGKRTESVFLSRFPEPDPQWEDEELGDRYGKLLKIRELATKALEEARQGKVIGNSLEARITVYCRDEDTARFLDSFGPALADLFIVSGMGVETAAGVPGDAVVDERIPGTGIRVSRIEGEKCERCWKYAPEVGKNQDHPTLCERCRSVLEG